MDGELAALASSGATTVVGLMATDAWTRVRDRIAGFFARGGPEQAGAAEEELGLSHQDLAAARASGDPAEAAAVTADTEAVLRARLRRILRSDPEAAAEFRALLAELTPEQGLAAGNVHNTISGSTHHGMVIQARDISGGVVSHPVPTSAPLPDPGPAGSS